MVHSLFVKAKTQFDKVKKKVEQMTEDVMERPSGYELQPNEIKKLKEELFMQPPNSVIKQLSPVFGNVTQEEKSLHWGMTMGQFDAFITACMGTYTYRWIKKNSIHEKKQWYNPSTKKVERLQTVNAYDIDKFFTRPLTAQTGRGVALNMQGGEGIQAEVMLSHAWGEDIEHILYLLRSFIGQPLASGKFFGNDTILWFCAFAQYQNQDSAYGPTVADQVALNNFRTVIKNVDDVIALHTTADDMYSRMWCVEELRCSAEFGKCVHFLATPDYVLQYTSFGRDNGQMRVSSKRELQENSDPEKRVPALSLDVDCEAAQGTDIKELKENIKGTIGFKYLNVYVYYLRQLLLQGYLNEMVRKKAVEEPAKISVFLPQPTLDNLKLIGKASTITWTPHGDIAGADINTPMPSIFLGFNQETRSVIVEKGIYVNEEPPNPVTGVKRIPTTFDVTTASDLATADINIASGEGSIPKLKSIDLRLRSHQQQYSPRDGSTAEIVDALNGVQDAVSELTQVISNLQRALAVNTPARPTTRENSNRNNSNRDVNTERWV